MKPFHISDSYTAPLLTLATMLLSAFVVSAPLPSRYLAPLFALAALVLLYWPMFVLRRHGRVRKGNSYMATEQVVDRGPFAVVRHPQYLGYICLNITFMLIGLHWLVLLLGAAAIYFFYRQAVEEEHGLLGKFGQEYTDYMARVPRFNILAGLIRLATRRSQKLE